MDEMVSFEEQLYREMVDRAFKGNDPQSFSNGKPEHAAYLIGRYFDHARSTIRLYCGSLARAVNGIQVYASSDVIGSALDFLRRPNSRLLIVLENDRRSVAGRAPTAQSDIRRRASRRGHNARLHERGPNGGATETL